jgi:hypothetical protein
MFHARLSNGQDQPGQTCNVCMWPQATVGERLQFRRSQGISRHPANRSRSALLTLTGLRGRSLHPALGSETAFQEPTCGCSSIFPRYFAGDGSGITTGKISSGAPSETGHMLPRQDGMRHPLGNLGDSHESRFATCCWSCCRHLVDRSGDGPTTRECRSHEFPERKRSLGRMLLGCWLQPSGKTVQKRRKLQILQRVHGRALQGRHHIIREILGLLRQAVQELNIKMG